MATENGKIKRARPKPRSMEWSDDMVIVARAMGRQSLARPSGLGELERGSYARALGISRGWQVMNFEHTEYYENKFNKAHFKNLL